MAVDTTRFQAHAISHLREDLGLDDFDQQAGDRKEVTSFAGHLRKPATGLYFRLGGDSLIAILGKKQRLREKKDGHKETH